MKHFVLLGMILSSAFAFAGPRVVKNGGDLYAIEFLGIGQAVLKSLQSHPLQTKVDLKKLAAAVDNTTVESVTTPLKLDGVDKDAINYPQTKRIVFNRLTWAARGELSEKAVLVLHEYLGIAGIKDSKYQISTPLIDEISYGKVSYNGEVLDRKLSKEEMSKLMPAYLSLILSKAKETPSPEDRNNLGRVTMAARPTTHKARNGGSESFGIDFMKQDVLGAYNDLASLTVEERVESTNRLVESFKEGKGTITCELGYENVTRWKNERIVKCTNDRSGTGDDGEGWVDQRFFILSIDGKTLEPLGVIMLDVLQAG